MCERAERADVKGCQGKETFAFSISVCNCVHGWLITAQSKASDDATFRRRCDVSRLPLEKRHVCLTWQKTFLHKYTNSSVAA